MTKQKQKKKKIVMKMMSNKQTCTQNTIRSPSTMIDNQKH